MFFLRAVFIFCFTCYMAAAAEQSPKPGKPVLGKRLLPSVAATSPVLIDGKLDEADWDRAGQIGDFEFRSDGTRPFKTEIRALHDEEKIYLAAICQCDDGEKSLVANEPEGGKVYRDDSMEIFLFSRNGKQFQVCANAAGRVLILGPDNMESGGGDFVKCGASWDEKRQAYVLELAMDRRKFDLMSGGLDSYGISFIRNMQVKAGGNRSYSFKWRDPLPEKWGHLIPADTGNLGRIRGDFSGRLKQLGSDEYPEEFRKVVQGLSELMGKENLSLGELAEIETELVRLETEALDKYWQKQFEKLFKK